MSLPELPPEIHNLLDRYWALAHSEGVEGRTHDTEDGAAQSTLHDLQMKMREYGATCARMAAQEERERCARLAEAPRVQAFDPQDDAAAEQMNGLLSHYFAGVAAAIRARGAG